MSNRASSEAAERGQLYGLLSMIFRKPLDARQLEQLRAPKMLAAMKAAGIAAADDFEHQENAVLLDRLAVDFTHIFHAPEGKIMPFEGMLLGRESGLKGDTSQRVEAFMAEVGYSTCGEMADHISVELAFMADLALREHEAESTGERAMAERSKDIQDRFLTAHLGRWAAIFAARVRDRAQTGFYAAMADFVADVVTVECSRKAA